MTKEGNVFSAEFTIPEGAKNDSIYLRLGIEDKITITKIILIKQ